MTNRKKRLQKGIDSIEEQISLHQLKRRQAEEEGNLDLENYYKDKFLKILPSPQQADGVFG